MTVGVEKLTYWLRRDHPKSRRRRVLAAGVAALLAWFVFGGRQGLFALAMSQREKASLNAQIADLTAQNARLEAEANALAADPGACEKVAREQLQLMRPGEIIYRFE